MVQRKAPDKGTLAPREDQVVKSITYQFLTPVFGGGVKVTEKDPRKDADPVTPVRVPSIRGQLRFWWRAVNPRGCTNLETLRAAEKQVFGGVEGNPGRSALVIRVVQQPAASKDLQVLAAGFGAIRGFEGLDYGAFPLRDTRPGGQNAHGVLHNYGSSKFEVEFSYPEAFKPDVEAALWAFAHFGGLGGRTRRGFGAVAQEGVLLSIEEGWKKWVKGNNLPWPHLGPSENRYRTSGVDGTGIESQKKLLQVFKAFRQNRRGGRQQNRPGRSYWPEPDEIRRLTGQSAPTHANPVSRVRKFPRGEFGLPIIFHFQGAREPSDTTLNPQDKERWASSLILRPHRRADQKIEGLALWLRHPRPSGFVLKGPDDYGVQVWLSPAEAKELNEVMGSEGTTSVIERFMKEKIK